MEKVCYKEEVKPYRVHVVNGHVFVRSNKYTFYELIHDSIYIYMYIYIIILYKI